MADVEKHVEDMMEEISQVGDDTDRFSQEESAEFYEGVASSCETSARALREEIARADEG